MRHLFVAATLAAALPFLACQVNSKRLLRGERARRRRAQLDRAKRQFRLRAFSMNAFQAADLDGSAAR